MSNSNDWTEIIDSKKIRTNSISGLWKHRDLILLFVRRDFVKEFKQTILGPLWFIIQPIFQTLVLLFVFGNIGGMGPKGIPQVSFYLGGALIWNLFSETLVKSSETFRTNAPIFGKVYFPRMVMPVALILTNFLKLGVQLGIFFIVYFYELSVSDGIEPNLTILLVPIYFIFTAMCGVGFGLLISALTTKYWDLRFLVSFGMQLLMFMSTVITPFYVLAERSGWMKNAIMANPVSSIIEAFRYAFLGGHGGEFFVPGLIYSGAITIIVLLFGVFVFQRVERNFMDTV